MIALDLMHVTFQTWNMGETVKLKNENKDHYVLMNYAWKWKTEYLCDRVFLLPSHV